MRRFAWVIAVASIGSLILRADDAFEFKDGDRVVLIGSTLIEREQRYGHWEAALVAALPEKNITFRNLGWSGDTVWGEARAIFDSPAVGYKRLIDHTLAEKPTVIIVGYGTNECFAGAKGLPAFTAQYVKLLNDLAPTRARFILLTPVPYEFGPAADRNSDRQKYVDAIREIAAKHKHYFADVGGRIESRRSNTMAVLPPNTDNGIHLTEYGYRMTHEDFLGALGIRPWEGTPEALTRWRTRDAEKLRQTIIAKNELYFHRWRPQNVTYLFGFRNREQGNNAVEIPKFDPLIAEKEKEIAKLRKQAVQEK